MSKILITGATGNLGRETVAELAKRHTARDIVALVRDPSKAADFATMGVDVRRGDYFDRSSLEKAFAGVDKLLLVSTTVFTDREAQHRNVIEVAKSAGVHTVVYTSIQRRTGSSFKISMVTDSDLATEKMLVDSGLNYTILRNGLYLEALPFMLGKHVLTKGVRVPGGTGRSPIVSRSDLAEANAVILAGNDHARKTYTLGASEPLSFSDIAAWLSSIVGHSVPYTDVDRATYVAERISEGVPEVVSAFLSEWIEAVANGEFGEVTGDLERILGRPTASAHEFVKTAYTAY